VFPLLEDFHRACPVCDGDRLRGLEVYRNRGRRVQPQRAFLALMGCATCGIVFTHPQPSEEQLEAFYASGEGWEHRISADRPNLDAGLAKKQKRHDRQLELLAPHLDGGAGRRSLDFGCGQGAWLDALQAAGWETAGIEPGPGQREIAGRRHTMLDAPPIEPEFDLVVSNHVFEHLRDPMQTARALAGALRPGGHLLISVPDLSRLPAHQDLTYVRGEVHIFSYTHSGMASLLGLAGLEVVERLDTPEWDTVMPSEPKRLRVLARKTGQVRRPEGRPLDEAVEGLRTYGRAEERRRLAAGQKEQHHRAAHATGHRGTRRALRRRVASAVDSARGLLSR
jgi:SAM-dependent methyltransferase